MRRVTLNPANPRQAIVELQTASGENDLLDISHNFAVSGLNANSLALNVPAGSGTLGTNPFSTVSGSSTVTVTLSNHFATLGETFVFSGALAFNGVTMNGTFAVTGIVSASQFTVSAPASATGNGAGGGTNVSFTHIVSAANVAGVLGTLLQIFQSGGLHRTT